MTKDQELDYLRRLVYRLTYTEEWLTKHGHHCLIPRAEVDKNCPVCIGNGWLGASGVSFDQTKR